MKKLSLITLALLTLLLAQCKKEKIDSGGTDANKVKVRCEIPMGNGEKTDFTDPLISSGSIQWSPGTEYLYLVINGSNSQIIELSANNETGASVTTLSFSGTMNANIISEDNTYQIWYFGNSRNLAENPYLTVEKNGDVITQIDGSIATQSGSLSDLGYHHIAMANVTATTGDNDEVVLSINGGGGLQSQIAIAYMDLEIIPTLKGTAVVGTEFSLSKNEKGNYSFVINDAEGANKVIRIQGTNETPDKSFVVLFPNTTENVEIIGNNIYKYTFKSGITANHFYKKYISDVEAATLKWDCDPFVNGQEVVDLRLPSGTLWAKNNIGASTNEESDDYYGWGEIYAEQEDYPDGDYYNDLYIDYLQNSKDITGTKYDAATQSSSWGANWCMPTKEQMEELVANCNCEYVTSYNEVEGLNGFKLTSKKEGYTDRCIFLPAADAVHTINVHTENGYYWSSTPSSSFGCEAYYLKLDIDGKETPLIYVTDDNKQYPNISSNVKCSIRPVVAPWKPIEE